MDIYDIRRWAIEQTRETYAMGDLKTWSRNAECMARYVMRGLEEEPPVASGPSVIYPMRVSSLAEARRAVSDAHAGQIVAERLLTVDDLKKWIDQAHPDQREIKFDKMNLVMSMREIGFAVRHKPDDVDAATDALLRHAQSWLDGFFLAAHGRVVYWRTPLEVDVIQHNRVVEYKDDGPDYDPLTDRKCVMDRSMNAVKCYMRVGVGRAS